MSNTGSRTARSASLDLFYGARQKLVLCLALVQQHTDRSVAAVAGQDFIFAIFQRSNDEVVQHVACKLDSGFQFLDLLH